MDSKKSNKIRDIVRLQQILKKWKKMAAKNNTTNTNGSIANANANGSSTTTTTTAFGQQAASSSSGSGSGSGSGSKSIKFLKRTLSFTDVGGAAGEGAVPKGFLAVSVGEGEVEEMKRFIIPTEYLRHQAFGVLLRKAEEEFGFQQEGVLKIPCPVSVFENILKMVQQKKQYHHNMNGFNVDKDMVGYCYSSPDSDFAPNSHHPQLCR